MSFFTEIHTSAGIESSPEEHFSQFSKQLKTRDIAEQSIHCQRSVIMHWRQTQSSTWTLSWICICFKEFSIQNWTWTGKVSFFFHFLLRKVLFLSLLLTVLLPTALKVSCSDCPCPLVTAKTEPGKSQIRTSLREWSSSWVLCYFVLA